MTRSCTRNGKTCAGQWPAQQTVPGRSFSRRRELIVQVWEAAVGSKKNLSSGASKSESFRHMKLNVFLFSLMVTKAVVKRLHVYSHWTRTPAVLNCRWGLRRKNKLPNSWSVSCCQNWKKYWIFSEQHLYTLWHAEKAVSYTRHPFFPPCHLLLLSQEHR